MKKSVLCGLLIAFSVAAAFAGDVATFVDKGISDDGKYYVFGQYGRTDKKFQGWAEIYQVDIKNNEWVNGGVFRTKPSPSTADKDGIEVYEALEAKSFYHFKNMKCKPANIEHVLYILDDVNKKGTDEIIFKDFRNMEKGKADTFHIQLIPTFRGAGKNISSSFYINLEKKDMSGKVITKRIIGSPDVVRKGVKNYKIEKIFCDDSEKSLIFIIEKMVEDETGTSIRYMVETAQF